MSSKVKFFLLMAILLSGIVALRWTPVANILNKDNLLAFLESIRGKWWGPLVFIGIYAASCGLAIPGSILTLAGGAIFGTWWGTLYNVLAANLGASLAFTIARFLGRDFLQRFTQKGKWAQWDERFSKAGFQTIFRLRLIPIIPFNALNYGAGLSSIHFRDYCLASILGMLPGTFIYTYFADALLQGVQGANRQALTHLAMASALMIALSFVPSLYKKLKGRNTHAV
jgi:uncharacterized membrane protein YdjX (TVP38/TMEM64 family)